MLWDLLPELEEKKIGHYKITTSTSPRLISAKAS